MNAWLDWLWRASWQASLLVPIVLGIQWVMQRRMPPEWRCVLWWVVVIRLCLPVFPTSSVSFYNMFAPALKSAGPVFVTPAINQASAVQSASMSVEKSAIPDSENFSSDPQSVAVSDGMTPVQIAQVEQGGRPFDSAGKSNLEYPKEVATFPWIALTWCLGALVMGIGILRGVVQINRICMEGKPLEDASVLALLNHSIEHLGIQKRPAVLISRMQTTPALIGWFRPVILLPEQVLRDFNQKEMKHILVHELAHLKRRDVLVNWLHAGLMILHWFNPVLWLAFYRMRQDRELAVDAMAIQVSGHQDGRSYGSTLLKLLETLNRPTWIPVSVGIAESKHAMKTRLKAIMSFGTLRIWKGYLVLGMCALSLIVLTDAVPVPGDTIATHDEGKTAGESEQTNSYTEEAANRIADFSFTDLDTNDAVSDVIVRFRKEYYDGNTQEWSVQTDEKGLCHVEWSDVDVKEFGYTTHREGYLTLTGVWPQDVQSMIPDNVEHQLSRGTEIGGMVLDRNGEPVEGARIFFDEQSGCLLKAPYNIKIPGYYTTLYKMAAGELLATTDREGRWSSRCIWPSFSFAHLRVQHSDFADKQYSTDITPAMESQGKGNRVSFEDLVAKTAKFDLEKGQIITGTIQRPDGTPASNVVVRYADRPWEERRNYNGMGAHEVVTDARGFFITEGLNAKRIYFAITESGFAPLSHSIDLRTSDPVVKIKLERGEPYSAIVTDREGKPVVNATVTFMDWSVWSGIEWETETDDSGRWSWANAPKERFRIKIHKNGFLPYYKIIQPNDPNPMVMSKPLKLALRVEDADTGLPIESFKTVWASEIDLLAENQKHWIKGGNGQQILDLGRLYAPSMVGGYFHTFAFQIKAAGYALWTSRLFESPREDTGELALVAVLRRQRGIIGIVKDSKGRPVESAQVAVITKRSRLRLMGKPNLENLESCNHSLTDSDGRFVLETSIESFAAQHEELSSLRSLERMQRPRGIVVVHPQGVCFLNGNEVTSDLDITLKPWSQIHGVALEYEKPLVNEEIQIWTSHLKDSSRIEIGFFRPVTDDNGHFFADYIPYGNVRAYRMIKLSRGGGASGPPYKDSLKPGQQLNMVVGGKGRPVHGKMEILNPYIPIDWKTDRSRSYVMTPTPKPPSNNQSQEEYASWRQQPKIKQAFENIRHHPIHFESEGTFRIDEVIPGKYDLSIHLYNPLNNEAMAGSDYITRFNTSIEVPESEDAHSRTPFNVGTFQIRLNPKVGKGTTEAPDISAKDLEGNPFELSSLKGKYILLDFWATWCGPCLAELPYLTEAWEKYKDRQDFAMVGLSVDKTIEDPIRFSKKNDLPGLQVFIGGIQENEIATAYNVHGIPATYLINPEGKIIAEGLSGHDIEATLQKLLPQE